VRTRDDLIKQRTAATNQLQATLDAFWPGAKTLFKNLFSDISLAFLERYPTPASAARLGEQRMASFLKKQGYCGRSKPAELVERLKVAAPGIAAGAEAEARRDSVLALVQVIKTLNKSIRDLERSVEAHLDEHPDAAIFTSLPRTCLPTSISDPRTGAACIDQPARTSPQGDQETQPRCRDHSQPLRCCAQSERCSRTKTIKVGRCFGPCKRTRCRCEDLPEVHKPRRASCNTMTVGLDTLTRRRYERRWSARRSARSE
jgi:hypothetical protein